MVLDIAIQNEFTIIYSNMIASDAFSIKLNTYLVESRTAPVEIQTNDGRFVAFRTGESKGGGLRSSV
jgi:hypothetical protein